MAYATDAQIRKISNFTTNEISDLTEQIAAADKWVLERITSKHRLEGVNGKIDGSNTEFRVQEYPIADDNLDSAVDANDVEIYYAAYSDVNKFLQFGSAQTVTSVVEDDGIINVTTAPTTTTAIGGVFATYRTWNVYDVDYTEFKRIASYVACAYAQAKVLGLSGNYHEIEKDIRKSSAGGNYLEIAKSMLNNILKPGCRVTKFYG